MYFYYPLTLGTRKTKSVVSGKKDSRSEPERQPYEAWREGLTRLEVKYEEHPENTVLQTLQHSTRTQDRRFWLILGEPGAGKSTLLEAWFTRWAAQLTAPHLGLSVPVLIRLRDLTQEDSKQDSATLADRLWNWGKEAKALLAGDVEPIYSKDRGRMFLPVWLLDGLDEVPPQLLDKGLYERLVNLPGLKVITCRTAVYQQSLRQKADRYKAREYEILGLKPHEQQTFLEKALVGNPSRVQALHWRIQQNIQIHLLAANPLMLGLIAEVSGKIELPSSRAEFYRLAIADMWSRKLADLPEALYMTDRRDHVLTELAQKMVLDRIEAPLSWLMQAAQKTGSTDPLLLIEGLKRAGIIRINPRRERFSFVHLTFQEFYLARALQPSGLQSVLERFWEEARYEETLGLLIALLFQNGQHETIAQGIQWLVKWGERTHRKNPRILWRKRRSPLRVALHLLYRAGIALEKLSQTRIYVWERVSRSEMCKLAVARDAYTPTTTLVALAHSQDRVMRWGVAANAHTPPETLAALAHDQDTDVRKSVAANVNTPSETLAALAHDQDDFVRWGVAANAHTPLETLVTLAHDQDRYVRGCVATNAHTPPETLAALAHDQERDVRLKMAENANTLPETLAALAHDQDKFVRQYVAANAHTPPETLTALAHDQDRDVRWKVAANAHTRLETLAALTHDQDRYARLRSMVENINTPPEALAALAHDQDRDVRVSVAKNAHTPPETLAALAHDQDRYVRAVVAYNAHTRPETLIALAHDQDFDVRGRVAENTNTPPETLAALTHDQNWQGWIIRNNVAKNAHTRPETLAALAHDQIVDVRHGVAKNAHTRPETLAALAHDQDTNVRVSVAANAHTLPETLAALAYDQDQGVRGVVSANANTLLEDLYQRGTRHIVKVVLYSTQ